jgi:hypothetical protein
VNSPLWSGAPPRSAQPGTQLGAAASVILAVLVVLVVAVVAVVIASDPASAPRRSDGPVVRPTTRAIRDGPTSIPPGQGRTLVPLLPTTALPLRVLEIGDSLGIDLGDQLKSQLDATGIARTTVASVGDSGLSNTTYFDWPDHLAGLLNTDRPQIVVVFMGANDDQGLYVNGMASAPDTLAWVEGYAQRVNDLVREATSFGARVVWVGMPLMANPDLNAAVQRENAIYERETKSFSATLYMSSSAVLDASGVYETNGEDSSGGLVALRTPDGVHLTPAGAGVLARAVIKAVDLQWDLTPGIPTVP